MSNKKSIKRHQKNYEGFHEFSPCVISYSMHKGNVREHMEDRIIIDSFMINDHKVSNLNGQYYVFAVCDGHGGSEVVDYTHEHLSKILYEQIQSIDQDSLRHCINLTFKKINETVRKLPSGTTISMILIKENHELQVWMANVGDSSIYGYRKEDQSRKEIKEKFTKLNIDHKVHLPSEKKRLERYPNLSIGPNGYVMHRNGTYLAMTRAIGDGEFEDGITWEPTVKRINIPYDIIIVASDGFWDVVKCKDIFNQLLPIDLNNKQDLLSSAPKILEWRKKNFVQHDNSSLIFIFFKC
jgi:serine/threonine protein phosphatase PrpC